MSDINGNLLRVGENYKNMWFKGRLDSIDLTNNIVKIFGHRLYAGGKILGPNLNPVEIHAYIEPEYPFELYKT